MSWGAYKESGNCAACANWGGPRTVGSCKRAEVEHTYTKGKCYLGRGPSSNGTDASYRCSDFEPWSALK